MKKNYFFRLITTSMVVIFCAGIIAAQSVTFNVAGTNPHCKTEYPNGVPYSGSATTSTVEGGGKIKSVTFQIQYLTGSSWGFWGPSFTVTPGFSTNTVNYSNLTPGATQLTITPVHQIRMRAIITYFNLSGGTSVAVVYSSITQFNYFGAPPLMFQINEKTTSPTVPLAIFLCEGTPMINFTWPTNGVGTGVQWRLLMFNSDANGTIGTPFSDYDQCPWQLGSPPMKFDPDEYGAGCHRPGIWLGIPNPPYLVIRIEFKNDCGTTVQDALIHVATQPSGAQVNFAFGGGSQADSHADYGAGNGPSDEEFNGVVNNSDGILSWGGTYADPTWVGGASTHLAGYSFDNFYGGLNSWTVKVEDVTAGEGAGQAIELGTFGGTGTPPAGGIFFNEQKLGYDPVNKEEGFFINNFNSLLGKIFKVTLTGSGVCNQNPSKSGYFRLIPGGKFWLTDPNQGVFTTLNNNDQSLSIYPNPTRGAITIDFNAAADAEGMIRILDMNGKVVSEINAVNIVKGKNVLNEDVSHLISGHYVLQVVNGDSVQHKQFMKSE